MRFRVIEIEVKQALAKSSLPDIDYALNPYLGCGHSCLYCYAKMYTRLSSVVADWGGTVAIKRNLLDVLKREVQRLERGSVGIGTITDPYQPVEALYNLTRSSIDILVRSEFKVSIQTKSSLIMKDMDILKRYRNVVDVGLTITSATDTSPMRTFEPLSSPPSARIKTLKKLSEAGIRTWIFYGPVIPGYNDSIEEVAKIIKLASETKSLLYIDRFRVKRFMWLDPFLKSIASRSIGYDWIKFYNSVYNLCRSVGVVCKSGFETVEQQSGRRLDDYLR
ncbi:MAG: radical SAM protein [Ignisphaera sp.]|nr:radical SAM protein [Ignisphaera sp.]MCX8167535.1 radical SAM protein [Ignisphaera sp.]MDW8086013.1 radical SAM protein [Ignisphaera sp.]